MEARSRELVRRSWRSFEGRQHALADAFYGRLFELDPRIENLFAVVTMGTQKEKFVAMLDEILRRVDDPDAFEEALMASGARHRGYGVEGSHYRVVGEALLWALDRVGLDRLDEDTRAAWAEAYTHMSRIMQNGARSF